MLIDNGDEKSIKALIKHGEIKKFNEKNKNKQ